MCGITGYLSRDKFDIQLLKNMTDTLFHRGPDSSGYEMLKDGSEKWCVGFGHRRLSILDLSDKGHQPMTTSDGRLWITFNGEIYNFAEIKSDLLNRGYVFDSMTDTEVILYGYREYGDEIFSRMNGMFALAIWDTVNSELTIARDRFGQKPLFYYHDERNFAFSSELKAIQSLDHLDFSIDINSIAQYFLFEYLPAPMTVYKSIHKLEQGHVLKWRDNKINIDRFWDVSFDKHDSAGISELEAEEKVIELLKESVKKRMLSDVPLGVFLSGGIDSSALVSLMSEIVPSRNIKTFSIGFKEASFDETTYADQVARLYRTDHHHKILSADKMLSILPDLLNKLDEPFADSSIIPTYLLSEFTREHVTVALGGDGGDELFAGYDPFLAHRFAEMYQLMPEAMHKFLYNFIIKKLPVSSKNLSFDFKLKQFSKGLYSDSVIRNQKWLGAFTDSELKGLFTSGAEESIDFTQPYSQVLQHKAQLGDKSFWNNLLYQYQKLYLADDILVKIDRASMMHSLEARSPFLDHELAEFVNSLPFNFKMRRLTRKYVLKKSLESRLPENILYRKKKGFGIPLTAWIKDKLNDEISSTILDDSLYKSGIFNRKHVKQLFDDHIKGKVDNRKKLWAFYVFAKVMGGRL